MCGLVGRDSGLGGDPDETEEATAPVLGEVTGWFWGTTGVPATVRSGPNRGMFVGAEGNGHAMFAVLKR